MEQLIQRNGPLANHKAGRATDSADAKAQHRSVAGFSGRLSAKEETPRRCFPRRGEQSRRPSPSKKGKKFGLEIANRYAPIVGVIPWRLSSTLGRDSRVPIAIVGDSLFAGSRCGGNGRIAIALQKISREQSDLKDETTSAPDTARIDHSGRWRKNTTCFSRYSLSGRLSLM